MGKKKTLDEVREIVESEGLGYAVHDYLSAGSIEDERLRQLWQEAEEKLEAIERMLG